MKVVAGERRYRGLLALALLCGLAAWALPGCSAVLGVKDTSFKNKSESLEEQSGFYAALTPFIAPAPAPLSPGQAVVLAPSPAAAQRVLDEERRCAAEDCQFAAQGVVQEGRLLAEALRKRGLFTGVSFQEQEAPSEAAPGLALEHAAVIYLDLRQRTWFYLPQHGGPADRLDLGLYLAQSHAEVRAWLAKVEEFLARPPLPKPPEPPSAPPPAKAPAKRPVKETKAQPKELSPAPFGLVWGAKLADLRRLKVKLGPPQPSGDLVEYEAQATPQRPENTDKIRLSLHKAHGLQKIVWRGAPIGGDAYGFLGREKLLTLQNLMEERYGPPSNVFKYLNESQFKARERFYSCLGQPGCGKWEVFWKLSDMHVALELVPVEEGVGAVVLTYLGPGWEKIMLERKRLEQEKLQKAIER